MISEGKITIDLGQDGTVQLRSNRRVDVGKLLTGRHPDEALALLPMIFSLCGQAHVAAARQALAYPGSKAEARTLALAVLAENAREHLLRIALGWRVDEVVNDMPLHDLAALVVGMKAAAGDEMAERIAAGQLSELLATCVFGSAPEEFLELSTATSFQGWIAQSQSAAAKFIATVCRNGWHDLGAAPTHYLPDLSPHLLTARLLEPSYTQAPDWLGQPRETGPLARQHAHPLVAALISKYGTGLLARLVARLIDLAKIPAQMRQTTAISAGGPGFGIVETARGRLIHTAKLQGGAIVDYRILAPTEWNFHPEGAAVQALGALPQGPDWAEKAGVLVQAIDPCVDFEVRAA